MTGQLYFQRGECLEVLSGDIMKAIDSYRRSMFIFELLGNEQYVKMVKEQKREIFAPV